jgi:hypothetical protein
MVRSHGSRRSRAVVAGALTLAAAVAFPTLAGAHSGPGRFAVQGLTRHGSARSNVPDPSFAGYLTQVTRGVTSVVADFRVPKLKCTSETTGIGPGAFVLAGPRDHHSFDFVGMQLVCDGGTTSNVESLVVNDVEFDYSMPLFVGDVLEINLTVGPSGTVAQLEDETEGHEFVLTKSGRGLPAASALVGEDALVLVATGAQIPVPNFGRIKFRSVSIGGKPLGSVPSVAYNMQTNAKVLQVQTGGLSGKHRNRFRLIFKHT